MPRIQGTPRDNKPARSLQLRVMSTVPTVRYGPGSVVMVANSTGKMLAVNTTGTTWKYCNVTSVLA